MTLDFILRLVLRSHEDVSFNIIFLNVLEGIKQFNLPMWFTLIKTSNCEKLVLYFSEKDQKIAAFSAQFIKIISHYKKIGYNINVLKQTACLVVNPITVGTLLSSLIARRWVGLQTLCWFRLKDLFIDEMVGA